MRYLFYITLKQSTSGELCGKESVMPTAIVENLDQNIQNLQKLLENCMDIVQQEITLHDGRIFLVYGETTVSGGLVKPSVTEEITKRLNRLSAEERTQLICEQGLGLTKSKQFTTLEAALDVMLTGDMLLFAEGCSVAVSVADKGYPGKPVGNCETEKVIRGSQEGFCDSVKANEALVRKRIRSTELKIVEKKAGMRSATTVAIVYMEGLAPTQFLNKLQKGLKAYELDGVFDSGTLEQLLEKDWASPFPQFQTTQRPDRAAQELLQGRVVLLCDNSPTALLLPAGFSDFFRVSEDRYNHFEIVCLERLLRYGAMLAALYISALYLAVVSFHTQILPTPLLLSLAEARKGVPFPPLIEVLLMELSFEVIREAGVRMPGPLSGTIGIVGGLIIGDAAVSANLVSPMSVIVVAFGALCTFAVPDEEFGAALRLVRFFCIFLGGFLGLAGIVCGIFWCLLHLCSLTSFGVPYMQIVHRGTLNAQDSLVRTPMHRLKNRPYFVEADQSVRLKRTKRDKQEAE